MANEFVARNGIIANDNSRISGTLDVSGNISSGGNTVATQSWVTATALSGFATESYVTTAISNLIDSAPGTLNTLNELAAALGDDPNFATTITNSIATKLPLAGGNMTGNINWTSTDKGLVWTMNTDGAYIKFFNTGDGDTNSRLEYATSDNGNEYHRFVVSGVERMAITATGISATGYNKSNWDTAYGWGNHGSAGYVTRATADTLYQPIGSYAAASHTHSATDITSGTLASARLSGTYAINVSGSAATLTTARTLTVGNTGKTFDGSANVSWSLAEIGAQPAGSYLTFYNETDTLATVTSRGASTTGDIYVNGLLTGGLGAATTSGTLDWDHSSNARAGQGYTLLLGNHANGPGPAEYFHPVGFEYSAKNGTGNVTQLAISYGSPGDKMYMRGRYSGSWTGWTQFITSANIGSQSVNYASSAGNANTLDSIDSSQFMRSDTADSFTAIPTFANGSSGALAARTGYSDFLGYNPSYGSYIGGGVGNANRYLYAGGYFYDGSTVQTLIHSGNIGSQSVNYASSAGSATSVVTIQDAAPAGVVGKLWWESDTGLLKVYYNSTSGWVDAFPMPDMTLYYSKAGGAISGDVSIGQTLTVTGNVQADANLSVTGTLNATGSINAAGSIVNTGSSTSFRNRISIGDGSASTPYTNTGSPGVWLSYGGGSDLFMGAQSASVWGAYIGGDWRMTVNSSGNVTATTFTGALSGNATTATTLQIQRAINGTAFNGSADITTSTWGTARTITIGNTGKSVNGGGDVSWSLAEIGAQAAGSYLTTSGKAADSNLFDGQDSVQFMRFLSSGAEASLDTYTDTGLRSLSYSGHSRTLMSFNLGGSPGTIQQEFHYNFPANGWRVRNKTDNTTWMNWSYVVMAQGNQGNISGTIFHSGNDGAGSGLDADLLDGQQGSYYAPIASPGLTGTPTAPTASAGTNSTQIATTAFVSTAISNLVDSAPGTLDTLNELAAALGDDPNFATTISNTIGTKFPISGGSLTGWISVSSFTQGTPIIKAVQADTNAGYYLFQGVTGSSEVFRVERSGNIVTSGTLSASGYNKSNWDTAYSWGNHASAGYQTASGSVASATNADTVDGLHASSFVRNDTTGQFLKPYREYGSYIASGDTPSTLASNMGGGGLRVDFLNAASFGSWGQTITWSGYSGYNMYQLAGHYKGSGGLGPDLYVRCEPNHAQNSWSAWEKLWHTGHFTDANITNWNTAYGWGNHASAGYAASSHTHSEYLKYNPDGDGIAISYDDSNPTVNGTAIGGGHWFGADGSTGGGYLAAKILHAEGSTSSIGGYFTGAMNISAGGNSTQVIDGSGNWVGNTISYATSAGSTSGNAATATTLQTARTINGTSFNGSANITTSTWGTARTITIGNTAKSVNGGANVSWSLAEIGAQAAGSYLTTSGKAADSELLDGLDSSAYMRDDGWNSSPGQDANTQSNMKSDFTYANNAPHTGDLIRFGAGGYSLQLNASYQNSNNLSFRTYNNDSAQTWNPWRTIIHSGNIGSQSVNYAASAGNADTVDGYHATNAASGLAIYASNGYLNVPSWINVGTTGIFSGTNNAHFLPNQTSSYGSWEIIGSRGGWSGIYFRDSGNNLMANASESGFYNVNAGWQIEWYTGTLYISKQTSGGGTLATVLDSSNFANYAATSGHNHNGTYLGVSDKAADSNLLDGLDLHTGRNNEANKVVRTDGNGYIQAGWINTTSGDNGTTGISRIYASHDGYIRYYTAANFISQLGLIYSGNIGSQSVSYANSAGSASSATTATTATQVVTIQDSAPGGAAGKLWWESDTGKLKVYYGSAWVDAVPIPDMSVYYSKAGGAITGDVTIEQTLTVVGNTLIQGTLTETSDARLKENVAPLQDSLNKVLKLKGVSFNKIDTPEVQEVGFIAQDVEAVIPELVTETEDGIKTVSYSRVTAVLVETIKEQQAQIDELKELVNKLSDKLNNL